MGLGLGYLSCLYGSLDLAGTEASGASVDSLGVAVYNGTDPLDVGSKRPLRLDIRVTHAVSDRLGLAADFTPGHQKNLLAGLTYDLSIVA